MTDDHDRGKREPMTDEEALTAMFASLVQDSPASEVSPERVLELAGSAQDAALERRIKRLKLGRNLLVAAVLVGLVVFVVPKLGHSSTASSATSSSAVASAPAALPVPAESAAPAAGSAAAGPRRRLRGGRLLGGFGSGWFGSSGCFGRRRRGRGDQQCGRLRAREFGGRRRRTHRSERPANVPCCRPGPSSRCGPSSPPVTSGRPLSRRNALGCTAPPWSLARRTVSRCTSASPGRRPEVAASRRRLRRPAHRWQAPEAPIDCRPARAATSTCTATVIRSSSSSTPPSGPA